MPDVLITGAAGFLGSHLVRHLTACGWQVTALARRLNGDTLYPEANWIAGDVTKPLPGLPASMDAVVHLAASTDTTLPMSDLLEANVMATARVTEYAVRAGAQHLVYASTGGVYGFADGPLREDAPIRPINAYSLTKNMGEQVIGPVAPALPVLVLRLFFPYGAGQTDRLVPGLIQRVFASDPVNLSGPAGHPRINPIHVHDVTRIIARCLELKLRGTLNVAGSEEITIRELASIIADVGHLTPRFKLNVDGPSEDLVGDISQLRDQLNCQRGTSLEEGLREAVTAYAMATQRAAERTEAC